MTTCTAMPWSASTWRCKQADALGQHGGVLTDGPRRPALEQPGPQLAFLGPGEAHDVLRVVGRPLDERQRLEHRVVDVGRHLGPLLGQGPRLALGDEVPHQAQPPGAEDDDARRDDEGGAADGPQRGDGRVTLDQQDDAARPDASTPRATRAMSQRRPSPWVSAPRRGTTSWSMNAFSDSLALRQIRTTTPMARKVGQPMNPTKATMRACS